MSHWSLVGFIFEKKIHTELQDTIKIVSLLALFTYLLLIVHYSVKYMHNPILNLKNKKREKERERNKNQ